MKLILILLAFIFSMNYGENCSPKDFLLLKNRDLQSEFLSKIKTVKKSQYPEGEEGFDDITREQLVQFLSDINIKEFELNASFEKEYHFNKAPEGFTDPKECMDKIEVVYVDDCHFILNIYDTFLVEPDWCTESMVSYSFKIEHGEIKGLSRQAAG